MSKGKEKGYRETLKGDRKSLKSEGGAKKRCQRGNKGRWRGVKEQGEIAVWLCRHWTSV